MSQAEVAHVIFYMLQTSGMCADMCACNLTHQMEKTASFPNELVKTKSDFIVRSVETGLGK